MSQKPSVLVVDDESGILDTLRILLRNEGFEVTTAQGGKAGLEQIRSGAHDLILSDVRMPQVSGLDILNAAREQDPMTPVILMTAQASLQSAISAVNSGAFYYIQKPFSNDELVAILRRACEFRAVRVENKQLKQEIRRRDKTAVTRPIGKSKRFMELLKLAEHVAPTESTVLIQGESGTGKEVVARYIHNLSTRADGPFMSINCGALPENLLESELFGHVKGSFTGAVRDKQGLFAAARGGTFFLDEVGEMPPSLQVKLLRVLQEREVIPVGATESIPVDVRIIAATNRNLSQMVQEGRFREDLFYRLNVVSVDMPPLRDRKDDIPALAEFFVRRSTNELKKKVDGIDTEAQKAATENLKAASSAASSNAMLDMIRYFVTFLIVGLVLFLAWRAIKKAEVNRVPIRVPLDLAQLEPRGGDRRDAVAVAVAAVAEEAPGLFQPVLPARQPLLAAHVLDEEQLTTGLEDPCGLGERRARVGHRAEHQREHRGIEAVVVERQAFGAGFVEEAERDCVHGLPHGLQNLAGAVLAQRLFEQLVGEIQAAALDGRLFLDLIGEFAEDRFLLVLRDIADLRDFQRDALHLVARHLAENFRGERLLQADLPTNPTDLTAPQNQRWAKNPASGGKIR